MYYTIKLCKEKSAYEVVPKQNLELNLSDVEVKLKELGYLTLSQTPIILVMEKELKISIYPSGKILVSRAKSEEKTKEIAEEIYKKIGVLKHNSNES